MSADIANWLRTSPRIAWETDFSYMLSSSIEHAALENHDGLSLFIQGLNAEFKEANPDKAFSYYRQAASKLDPLSLCRLHEIYMGDSFFKTQIDVDKAVIYLVFAGLYSQDVDFDDSVVPFKKLKAFLAIFDPKCQLTLEIFKSVNDHSINAVKDLTYCLLLDFQEINQEKQRNDFLSITENLPVHVQKNILYTIYLNEFRLPWAHAVHRKENLVLRLMQNAEIFENFFLSYKGLVSLATINRTMVVKFRAWLQTILFVIDFAALSPAKKAYYHTLMLFMSQALDKNIFDNKDTQCWLRYFLAYCHEKGIEGEKNPQKALELIQKNIIESPEGIKYPLRQAILLKQMGKVNESRTAIERFEDLFCAKAQNSENSLLCYTRAKSYEKYYDDIDRAVRYYTKGTAELDVETPQQTYFFYSYWRIKCLKKLEKLKQQSTGTVRTTITGILSKMKTTEVEPQKNTVPVHKEVLDEHHKPSLFLESKSILEGLGIRVFPEKEVKSSKDQPPNILIVNKAPYYAEKFEIDDADILRRHSQPLEKLFSEHNQKLVPVEGVYLKEKGSQLVMVFLTPEFALDLHQVIKTNMFYDIKTKIHVATQVALCLIQIHESNKGAYYGTLKPKKILLDKYFSVKLHDSCIKMQRYQVLESDVYLAPEQFQGMDGPSSDIWAFGRILWELLCEHTVEESQLKQGEKESLEGIEELIQRMTNDDADKRVAIRDVYDELKEIYNKIPRI